MSSNIPTFYTGDPYTGLSKYVCIMKEVMFDDGIKRIICVHPKVHGSHWPKDVYELVNNEYKKIGTYKLNNHNLRFFVNDEITGDVQYIFVPLSGGSKKSRSKRRRGRKLRRRTRKY